MSETPELYCSFCGKSDREAETLVAGPSVFICDECIELSVIVVIEKRRERKAAKRDTTAEGTGPDHRVSALIEAGKRAETISKEWWRARVHSDPDAEKREHELAQNLAVACIELGEAIVALKAMEG